MKRSEKVWCSGRINNSTSAAPCHAFHTNERKWVRRDAEGTPPKVHRSRQKWITLTHCFVGKRTGIVWDFNVSADALEPFPASKSAPNKHMIPLWSITECGSNSEVRFRKGGAKTCRKNLKNWQKWSSNRMTYFLKAHQGLTLKEETPRKKKTNFSLNKFKVSIL